MTSNTYRFLTTNQVKRLYITLVDNAAPIQPGLLESAVMSPMNLKHYGGQDNLFQLAANLSEKIMKNHAFQDGNKRLSVVAADMFLKMNGFKLKQNPLENDVNDALANVHVKVTTNEMSAQDLGKYYEGIATRMKGSSMEIQSYCSGAQLY